MSDKSAIEWTDATWNPTTGCEKVSPGCAHCYIDRTPAFRIPGRRFVKGATDLRLHEDRLDQPLRWKRPRRVFVNSLSDLFHPEVPDDFLNQVYEVMEQARQHTFQVLTKRAARMRDYLNWRYGPREDGGGLRIPSRHIWHGVSVENQRWAEVRIPMLLQARSAVRFISAEPLLGPVDLSAYLPVVTIGGVELETWPDWVIVGGESGPGARAFDLAWARDLVRQCSEAGVAVFVKQLGSLPVMETRLWRSLRPTPILAAKHARRGPEGTVPLKFFAQKAGDAQEWPADLRVREFPR